MNRSVIFRNAWISARNLATVNGGNVRQYIGEGLRKAWQGVIVTIESLTVNANQAINDLAQAIRYAINLYYMSPKKQEALAVAESVAEKSTEFGGQVAATVARYRKCTDKQAYHIAKAAYALGYDCAREAQSIYTA
jgi:hypothetical protein